MASSWYGWPSSFYLYGSFGIIWTVLWIIFGASSPAHHKYILTIERDYIQESLGTKQEEEGVSLLYMYKYVCVKEVINRQSGS